MASFNGLPLREDATNGKGHVNNLIKKRCGGGGSVVLKVCLLVTRDQPLVAIFDCT